MRQIKLILAAFLLVSPFAANADLLGFELSDPVTGDEFSWMLDSDPTPDNSGIANFWIYDVLITLNGSDFIEDLRFWTGTPGGGLTIGDNLYDYFGPVLFDNGTAEPHFNVGEYMLFTDEATLRIFVKDGVSVPEPGTLALFSLGLFGLGLALVTKRSDKAIC